MRISCYVPFPFLLPVLLLASRQNTKYGPSAKCKPSASANSGLHATENVLTESLQQEDGCVSQLLQARFTL